MDCLNLCIISLLAAGLSWLPVGSSGDGVSSICDPGSTSIHGLSLTSLDEETPVPLSAYAGKVLVVVNVASFCQFTVQYLDFNKLKQLEEFEGRLEILAIPSNQFGLQEPGDGEEEIRNSLKYVRPGRGFSPDFDLFQKSDVNGRNEIPLYGALKHACQAVKEEIGDSTMRFWTPFKNNDITWNFNKFLIGPDGRPLKRYDSVVGPMDLVDDIREVITMTLAAKKRTHRYDDVVLF